MRITRYINGKRIDRSFDNSIILEKPEIMQVIYKVNRRLFGGEETNILNNYGAENE